jgi:DNA-nicking Smr family endonuclease
VAAGRAGVKLLEPPRRRTRKLSEEEIALWAEVARTVQRRQGAAAVAAPPDPPRAPIAPPAKPLRDAATPAPTGPPPLAPLERKLKRELSRGRGGVDSALDLHGLNQAEAHHALRGFLVAAQARGDRLVIVVTGKGRAGTSSWIDEPGVLRRLAPHWLRAADMRGVVLGFEEASRVHGGAGALYVRLRRDRGR